MYLLLWLLKGLLLQGISPAIQPERTEAITLSISGGTLDGTLELPRVRSPYPVALIISGSGPVDRNGNAPGSGLDTNCYKLLAQGLALQGIASVRYDKRGVSAGTVRHEGDGDLRVDDFIDDAESWGRLLRHDVRFSTLTVVGHSEGSLVGMIAARKISADGFVSLAGPGQPLAKLMLKQLEPQLPPDAFNNATSIISSLEHGRSVSSVPSLLKLLLGEGVQGYLISLFRYDPVKEIASLSIPIMIVQGDRDLQVDVANAYALAEANSHARMVLIPKMNHVFKDVEGSTNDNLATYHEPQKPISPKLVTSVANFIHQLTADSRSSL